MATPSINLIAALRNTAHRLKKGAKYQWGHMGQCNCGNLAQELIQVSATEIHQHALLSRSGDWSEQTAEYCPTSNLPLDLMITKMLAEGLTIDDLKNLEKLSDKAILRRIPRYLSHNSREDVILYIETWAKMLEEQLIETIELPTFATPTQMPLPAQDLVAV
ncbi:MAG: hypothetical protein ACOVQA_06055 [Thermoflexibacteraceae bacterium]